MIRVSCIVIVLSVCCTFSVAEDFALAPMTGDQKKAMATIRESDVLATVSFLASDEMAGRNTPSTELNIAAAYVAARFRGAGLDGLGPDGSYYQTTELTQYLTPRGPVAVLVDEKALPNTGLLFGGENECELTAPLISDKDLSQISGKVVVIDEFPLPPQAVDNPAMLAAAWSRRVGPLARNGAAAILVRTSEDSLLPEAARQLQEKPLRLPAQFLVPCPVILVSASTASEGKVSVQAPPRIAVDTPVRNVISVLRGRDPELSKQAIIISAHLDHIGRLPGDRQGDMINNGADDNATGVTAVVALADAFARLEVKPKCSVIFVTFWGEELGLLGSKYYAEHPLWPLEQTIANINIEMIGRPEENADGKAWGTGWTRSSLGLQMAAGASRANVEVFHREDVSEMLYTRSDNYSLASKGVIAHSFSAGSLHGDYHQPSDEVSKLNLTHMTRIIRGLFAGTLPIAEAELTPVKTEKQNGG